jgi:hypothetical protein
MTTTCLCIFVYYYSEIVGICTVTCNCVCVKLVLVAVQSKEWVCGRLIAWIAVSNPAEGICVCCVGSGLCDKLRIPTECVCLIVCALEI